MENFFSPVWYGAAVDHGTTPLPELPGRPVQRARLLLGTSAGVVVQDVDDGDLVRVPGLPPGADALALSADGTALLVIATWQGRRDGGLCLHNLGSGQQRWFDAQVGGQDRAAALSPDGTRMATLTIDTAALDVSALACLWLVDVETGRRERVWSGPGSWSQESVVSWSPDGHVIAATYLSLREEWATVVVDIESGTALAEDETWATLPSTNGTWTPDGALVRLNADWVVSFSRATGRGLEVMETDVELRSIPLAVAGERFVQRGRKTFAGLITTDLQGGDARPFVAIGPGGSIDTFDLARLPDADWTA